MTEVIHEISTEDLLNETKSGSKQITEEQIQAEDLSNKGITKYLLGLKRNQEYIMTH